MTIRLLEKLERSPEYAKRLKVEIKAVDEKPK